MNRKAHVARLVISTALSILKDLNFNLIYTLCSIQNIRNLFTEKYERYITGD